MSAGSSMPIDRRTVVAPMPAAARCAAFRCECVIDAGCETSDRASPMFATRRTILKPSTNRSTRS